MENEWSPEEEARRLEQRFIELKRMKIGQAEFARLHKVPGGASMVSQHIKNHRPINLASAIAYAKGFGCGLEEISPRLAREVQAAPVAHDGANSQSQPNLLRNVNETQSASALLLSLTARLQELSQGGRNAAAELIAESIKSPSLAGGNAALLESMLSGGAPVATVARSEQEIFADLRRLRKPFPDDDIDAAEKRAQGG